MGKCWSITKHHTPRQFRSRAPEFLAPRNALRPTSLQSGQVFHQIPKLKRREQRPQSLGHGTHPPLTLLDVRHGHPHDLRLTRFPVGDVHHDGVRPILAHHSHHRVSVLQGEDHRLKSRGNPRVGIHDALQQFSAAHPTSHVTQIGPHRAPVVPDAMTAQALDRGLLEEHVPAAPRIAAFLLACIFATGAITAGYHAGGELDWWTLPAACAGGGTADLESLTALAFGVGVESRPVMCDAVAWSFLGVSMAGWNTLISAALALFSLLAAQRPKDARAPRK